MPTDIVAKVGDHDFHVVSLTPSVTLCVEFDGTDDTDPRGKSFYKGTAHVCLKDSIFQPSHAERHEVELTCADHIEAFFYTATPSSRQQLSVKLC